MAPTLLDVAPLRRLAMAPTSVLPALLALSCIAAGFVPAQDRRRPLALAAKTVADIVPPPETVKNTYWCIRHGQSTANVANVISSDPVLGSASHELTELGRSQARSAGGALWASLEDFDGSVDLGKLALYSSNFTRARETSHLVAFEVQRLAQLAAGDFECPPLVRVGLLEGLRERGFGDLDGMPTGAYDDVFRRDLADPFDGTAGVEPVADVCARLRRLVDVLERRHAGDHVVLTAHADTIQIFQTWFARCDVRSFSSYRFANGECRRCDDAGECLPEPAPMASQAGGAK